MGGVASKGIVYSLHVWSQVASILDVTEGQIAV